MKNKTALFLILLLAGTPTVGFFAYRAHRGRQAVLVEKRRLEIRRASWEHLRSALWSEINAFPGEAGILIEDLETGWKLGYQYDERFPAASLVKVPVMAACYQAVRDGKLNLTDLLVLKKSDKVGGSGVLKDRPPGTALSVQQLIELMVSESDNTATNMLINRLGFEYLNRYFNRAGLRSTTLVRRMMDFSGRKRGIENYTTAQDIASVLRRLYYFQVVSSPVSTRCLELLMQQKINDRIPAELPSDIVVAHKTGLENGVCHDSGIVFTSGGNYLITVLTKHRNKTAQPAKKFIARIASLTYRYMTES